jgi:hypothetical protein
VSQEKLENENQGNTCEKPWLRSSMNKHAKRPGRMSYAVEANQQNDGGVNRANRKVLVEKSKNENVSHHSGLELDF